MNYEEFKARLDKELSERKFSDPKSLTGEGFNSGLNTMYYAALTIFTNMETELIKEGYKK